MYFYFLFFFSSRRRHTRYWRDWSSDVCSSDCHVSRWIQSTIVEPPGLPYLLDAPTVTVDTTMSTSDTVVVHIATSLPESAIDATQVQIRQSGGSWPSTTATADGNIVIQGYVRDVAVPWSGGGTVELRARFLGSPNSDWSS